jgi:hypothetical protein
MLLRGAAQPAGRQRDDMAIRWESSIETGARRFDVANTESCAFPGRGRNRAPFTNIIPADRGSSDAPEIGRPPTSVLLPT